MVKQRNILIDVGSSANRSIQAESYIEVVKNINWMEIVGRHVYGMIRYAKRCKGLIFSELNVSFFSSSIDEHFKILYEIFQVFLESRFIRLAKTGHFK